MNYDIDNLLNNFKKNKSNLSKTQVNELYRFIDYYTKSNSEDKDTIRNELSSRHGRDLVMLSDYCLDYAVNARDKQMLTVSLFLLEIEGFRWDEGKQ